MNFRNTKLRQRQTRGELGGHFSQCEHPELFSSISWCLNCTLVIKIIKTVENTQYFSSIIITGTHYLPYLRRQKDELMSALFAGSKSGGEGFLKSNTKLMQMKPCKLCPDCCPIYTVKENVPLIKAPVVV